MSKLIELYTLIESENSFKHKILVQQYLTVANPVFSFQREEKILAGRNYAVYYTAEAEGIRIYAEIRSGAEYRKEFQRDYYYNDLFPKGMSKVRVGMEKEGDPAKIVKIMVIR